MSILFVNGSPNADGNTAALAKAMVGNQEYKTVMLTDYRINVYGQELDGDQFDKVLAEIKAADTVIIGSPLYWHNICGSVRTLLDRFYGPVQQNELAGKKLAFVFQGAAPEKWMLEAGEYTMKRFAGLYGMSYIGMATNIKEAKTLSEKL
ncbi:MAG: NAD(P)H-dependent oxidoreductase [Ruminococcus sp.]|nr:NAD(P)H-dependent oxidoreductase [Ruminococcus sp.]